MADFINTIDVLGDDAVIDGILQRTIAEFKDNDLTKLFDSAFRGCTALVEVDLPNVTEVGAQTFASCSALEKVNLPEITDLRVTAQVGCFSGCKSLREINIPKVVTIGESNNNNWAGTFSGLPIERLILPNAKYIGRMAFGSCKQLVYADFGKYVYFWGACFESCSALKTVVLRSESLCGMYNSGAFSGTPIASGNGYFYVPRALVDSYKAATNWSVYGTMFRALEDYTVDGTITGELDEVKIAA